MLEPAGPIDAIPLFPRERLTLVALLASLDTEAWSQPTICPGWDVHDIVAHLLGDDLGRLSRNRDDHRLTARRMDESVPAFVDRQNAEWVQAFRRVSGPALCSLLELTGSETQAHFEALDSSAMGSSVWWATGDEPAPIWLDLARELTERWHHQQQIRDAVGAAPLDDPDLLGPVIGTFAFALPRTFREIDAPQRTAVEMTVTGSGGGTWSVVREARGWRLHQGSGSNAVAYAEIDVDDFWRLVTKGRTADDVRARVRLSGDPQLAGRILQTMAVIG